MGFPFNCTEEVPQCSPTASRQKLRGTLLGVTLLAAGPQTLAAALRKIVPLLTNLITECHAGDRSRALKRVTNA